METEFINITEENADTEHLCCIIRTRTAHPGVEAKRRWLKDRLKEGHVFRKLNINGTVFIEYAPLETAWVPITGDNFYYIYCLWVTGAPKGHGYGKQLMEYCINDAKMHNKSGICMLGSKKQKLWLSDKKFAQSYGFESVDETGDGYELLALSFDGAMPRFAPNAKKQAIDGKKLTVFYDDQCPFTFQRIEKLCEYCKSNNIDADFIHVEMAEQAKNLPCVFNNFAVFYNGKFKTVNQIDGAAVEKMIKKS